MPIRLALTGLLATSVALGLPLMPTGLTVEDQADPLAVTDTSPEFAWQPRDNEPGSVQGAYQIMVASSLALLAPGKADKWDSGVVRAPHAAHVEYLGKPLASRETCYWTVRTWNSGTAVSPWAQPRRFAMGLLQASDWSPAKWIWRAHRADDDYATLRKEFDIPAGTKARIYVSASHQYQLRVNGQMIGRGPNFAYPEHQYYRVHEADLRAGRNTIEALCHWWGPGQGRPRSERGFILQLTVDGKPAVVSDNTWRAGRAQWVEMQGRAQYRNGEGIPAETVDARIATEFASAVETDRLPLPVHGQTTEIEETTIAPVSVKRVRGAWVADFGKVYAGRPLVRFLAASAAGETVKMSAAYRLDANGRAITRAQSTDLTYRFVRSGKPEAFEAYWYLGYRYFEVAAEGNVEIRMVARSNRVRDRAQFTSSNATLNQIWDLVRHSVRYGSQEQFIDTPTREQGQFAYDAYTTSMAALRLFREPNLGRQALREFAQSQAAFHSDTGKINAVYPNGDGKRDIPDWTQSYVFWLWEWYRETGDRALLAELYPTAARICRWVKSTENTRSGLVDLGNDEGYPSGIVDWPDRYGYDRKTTQRTVMSVNAWLDYSYAAELAAVLGERRDIEEFGADAAKIAGHIEALLWNERERAYIDGLYADGAPSAHASQQANAMMAATGLARGARLDGALRRVKSAGFETSVLLAQFVVRALGSQREGSALLNYATDPNGLNWARTLRDGATFTYENWLGRARPKSEDSESHPFGAYAAVRLIQEFVLGVELLEAGGHRVRVRPVPMGLAFARGVVPLAGGDLGVDLAATRWRITVPVGVEVEVHLPDGRVERRGSGDQVFELAAAHGGVR
ncbi:MAG: family 78 glycoside hydrolase catalytic domain [Bryobacteraceae bacterium]